MVYKLNNFILSSFLVFTAIIGRFGLETILIYTALLLKRRIVVYHHDVDSLIEVSKLEN